MNKTHKTEWNLGLIYKNPKDPKVLKDVAFIDSEITKFEKKYKKNKKYLENANELLKALNDYENLIAIPDPIVYFYLFGSLDSENKEVEAMRNKVDQLLTSSYNKIIFFTLSLGAISPKRQKEILQNPKLKKFGTFLKNIFETSKYRLSESEEKIMNMKSLPASELWVQGQNKLLSSQTVKIEGKSVSLGEALNIIKDFPTNKRRKYHIDIMNTIKSISYFAESEINTIVINKKISDELRGYKMPYSATIVSYENNEKTVLNLVDTVTSHFKISHRFFKVKAQMLGVKELAYADRAASVGKTSKKIPFEEGFEIVRSSFHEVNPVYSDILDMYIKNGQIDVFPKKGKEGGAYCWSNVNLPTFVFLNYTDSLDSVSTFAHEMGHAIHGEFSKKQPPLYENHSISTAEVASTLFENFAFEKVFATLNEKEKIVALHDKIQDDISTIFRQIALFNFEVELHHKIREKGALSKEEIAELMNKHMSSYLGPICKLTPLDGYFFVNWSHIRRFFYVYSYAYGQLISKALYGEYKKNPKFIEKIEKFLSAGKSMRPEEIWKSIGIDIEKPGFFDAGLKSIEEDIIRLEKLVKGAKKTK